MLKSISILLFLIYGLPIITYGSPNRIQVGTAPLSVTIVGADSIDLSQTSIIVETSPLFNDLMDNRSFVMKRDNNVFSLDVPVELEDEIVGLKVESDRSGFGGIVTISQRKPTDIRYTLRSGSDYPVLETDNSDDLSKDQWGRLNKALLNFYSSEDIVPDSLYRSWEEVREYENNIMFPKMLHDAFECDSIPQWVPDWFLNSLKCRFASTQSIPYVKSAEAMNGLTVDEPPMESYSFLNSISYTPDFLMRLPYTGLKSFLYALLRFPDGGFDKIGDTPVDNWQEYARQKLLPAISKPSPLLLDLMAAMSYVEQVDIRRIPLNNTQIDNIKNGLDNGLVTILLDKNDRLALSISKESELLDLSEIPFDLREYIDTNFPGQPIILDTWNTWCAPCMEALGKVKRLSQEVDTSDIIFLYISSESSPLEKWKSIATDIGGIQIRVSESDFKAIGQQYELTALPSYIIFNKEHIAVGTHIGIPTKSDFDNWLLISSK